MSVRNEKLLNFYWISINFSAILTFNSQLQTLSLFLQKRESQCTLHVFLGHTLRSTFSGEAK